MFCSHGFYHLFVYIKAVHSNCCNQNIQEFLCLPQLNKIPETKVSGEQEHLELNLSAMCNPDLSQQRDTSFTKQIKPSLSTRKVYLLNHVRKNETKQNSLKLLQIMLVTRPISYFLFKMMIQNKFTHLF